ncbi:MAG: CHASE2 domain-containing protein [Proteobacteria bacterium]|nr:CHASE2 domain-containing protein [Pseudomonadota bacterium]
MTPSAQAGYRRNLRREWVALSLLILGLVAWLCLAGGLRRIDHLVQDAGMRLYAQPASPDIVIVAIDDRSIESIGRWPWRRALHAQLVDQITAQSPRALGLDILFGEEDADYPGDDLLLARALERNGRSVLPVARRGDGPGSSADAPLPLLRRAAAQLGHVQLQLDEDGVARSLFQREGPQPAPWPHFSTALQCAAGPEQPQCLGHAAPASGPWVREDLRILRFAKGEPAFTTYSYLDVLKGQLPPNALRDKYVIVGATATGLGDMFAAPMVTDAERVAGVEMIAHALNAELLHWRIRPAPVAWNLAFNLTPVALALLAIVLLGPLAGLLASATLFLATLLAAGFAAALVGWQFAAAPALAGIAAVYPLWSWRQLSAAAHFLQLEMRALRVAGLPPLAEESARPSLRGDLLERRIHAVEDATRRLRKLHHFVSDSLQHLPSPTFVCDAQGRVNLANEAALHYLPAGQAPQGQAIAQLLAGLVHPHSGRPLLPQDASHMAELPAQQEGQDAQGRHMLTLCKPFELSGNTIWLVTLVDLTDMRRAQRQRDQALHFISHDIRAPGASILTLLEMRREFPEQLSQQDLLARIERHARSSLAMAEGFVQLASAQAHEYHSAPFDLAAALEETVDDAWATAQDHQVQLRITELPQAAPIQGDRALICRAITNIVSNAIKFSPPGSAVQCALRAEATYWVISVRDQGPGIAPEQQSHLFQPFKRLHEGSHPGIAGVGLGLALVQTVLQRHGGQVQVRSTRGAGAEFRLLLPLPAP